MRKPRPATVQREHDHAREQAHGRQARRKHDEPHEHREARRAGHDHHAVKRVATREKHNSA